MSKVASPAFGDLPGPVGDVGVEHCPDPRPVGGQRQFPVGADLLGQPDQLRRRVGMQGTQPRAEISCLGREAVKVIPNPVNGSSQDLAQFHLQFRGRAGGRRVEEVGDIARWPDQFGQPPFSEAGGRHSRPYLLNPALMHRMCGSPAEQLEAGPYLPHRRHSEPHLREIACRERQLCQDDHPDMIKAYLNHWPWDSCAGNISA